MSINQDPPKGGTKPLLFLYIYHFPCYDILTSIQENKIAKTGARNKQNDAKYAHMLRRINNDEKVFIYKKNFSKL